jgi:fatty acid synthase
VKSGERRVVVSLEDEDMDYLSGHVIDGRNLFPAMGYIVSCALSLILSAVI